MKLFWKNVCNGMAALMLASCVSCSGGGTPAEGSDLAADGSAVPKTEEPSGDYDFVSEHYIYKHVFVIGIDGAGHFHTETDTPNIDRIFESGTLIDDCLTSNPTISAQCWGSLLTGVAPSVHGLTNDVVNTTPYENSDYPTFFKLARDKYPDAALAAYCNWNQIYRGIIETDIGVVTDTGNDPTLDLLIPRYIKEEKPTLMFVQFDSIDGAGHSYGYGSEKYLEELTRVDGYIGDIYRAIDEAGILEDSLFIVTADHGGIGSSHGGLSDDEKYIFFCAAGKTINKTNSLDYMQIRDIPAIVAYALGLNPAPNWDSYIPANLFTDNMTPSVKREELKINAEEHSAKPTPASDSDDYIGNYIDMSKLRAGMFCDGDLSDVAGNEKIEKEGTLYFVDGYYGQAVRVSSEGYVSLPEIKFEDKSFTISCWMNMVKSPEGDPALFSNKSWEDGGNKGFIYSVFGGARFNVGDGKGVRSDFDFNFDCDPIDNWVHITLVVDRETQTVTNYFNFAKESSGALDDGLENISFDSLRFNIGQDGTGRYEYAADLLIDDFLIFDGALTEDEIASMKNYYIKD